MNIPQSIVRNFSSPIKDAAKTKLNSFDKSTLMFPVVAVLGAGICVNSNLVTPVKLDSNDEKRKVLVWDFFDPQGHHQIDE